MCGINELITGSISHAFQYHFIILYNASGQFFGMQRSLIALIDRKINTADKVVPREQDLSEVEVENNHNTVNECTNNKNPIRSSDQPTNPHIFCDNLDLKPCFALVYDVARAMMALPVT